MDLIDRSKINFYHLTGPELKSAIEEAPSVPAVPLDKLCEWLGKVAILRCCECTSNYCDGKECSSSNHFDKEIKKWMEEQDAAD